MLLLILIGSQYVNLSIMFTTFIFYIWKRINFFQTNRNAKLLNKAAEDIFFYTLALNVLVLSLYSLIHNTLFWYITSICILILFSLIIFTCIFAFLYFASSESEKENGGKKQ